MDPCLKSKRKSAILFDKPNHFAQILGLLPGPPFITIPSLNNILFQ